MATKEPLAPAPAFVLTVIHAFGNYRRGDIITDPAEIAVVMAGENATSVNKVSV